MTSSLERSVATLPEQIDALPAGEQDRVHSLFSVVRSRGNLVPPAEMEPWLERSFGSVDVVREQVVIKTQNRWTCEGSLFNSLRARRPVESKLAGSVEGTAGEGQDPFCHPLTGTPADAFGRIRGEQSITASNVAKYDALHGVIVFDRHNPLSLSLEEITDAFHTANRWLEEAHRSNPRAAYPFVMWNCLPRSGASIVHAHLQVALGEGSAYSRVELWRRASNAYREQHQTGYFDALFKAHESLGLGEREGVLCWMAHLTPVKEKELVLLAPAMDDALYAMIYRMLRLYIDRLGVRAYNVAIYRPPLAPVQEDWTDFPLVVRLVDRGDPTSATSDVAAMELFAQPVVAFDPWTLARMAQEHAGADPPGS